jgi:hypothetical protein
LEIIHQSGGNDAKSSPEVVVGSIKTDDTHTDANGACRLGDDVYRLGDDV